MPNPLIEAIVDGLRATSRFGALPVMNRPENALWAAHDKTLHSLRLPLYPRLRRPGRLPKPTEFETAIAEGTTLLGVFAQVTGTKQAIVRLTNGETDDISFQPRPFEANWTRELSLSPPELANGWVNPLSSNTTRRSDVQTSDLLHMARKVALAFVESQRPGELATGTVTFDFQSVQAEEPAVRLVYRRHDVAPGDQSTAIHEVRL